MTETTPSPLSPNEEALLRAATAAPFTVAEVAPRAGLREDQAQSSAEALVVRGLLERQETVDARLALGPAGRRELPETQLLAKLSGGPIPIQAAQDLPGVERAAAGAAFGGLKKLGLLRVEGGLAHLEDRAAAAAADRPGWDEVRALEALRRRLAEGALVPYPLADDALPLKPAFGADAFARLLEARLPSKRGKKDDAIFEVVEQRRRSYRVSPAGEAARERLGESVPEVGQLTPQMLKDGSWRNVRFRRFHVADPPVLPLARRNPYRAFLDGVKLKLLSLGFEEMTGSLVEPEFWDMDALFLPQFHPAREIHDVYFVEDAGGGHAFAREVEGGALEVALEPVAREHEGRGGTGSRGWGYEFDRERTKRLVLRSQGTVLSARWLRKARVPGKYFAMARCFRYDTVDATHAPDFFQVEGIVVSERASLRHLLGLLELFAREVARSDAVKFVPAYFPFTEPSVEVHMRHPALGWIELGGAGIFRPEVTAPHGVSAPVIAWGLGLDRMAMVALGIDDIRHLFTNNLPDGLSGLRAR